MTLNGKCHAGDLCVVLNKKTSASRELFKMAFGGAIRPLYYEAHQTLILSPATDKDEPSLQTITDAIVRVGHVIKESVEQNKSIIIPVAEQQRMFGFQRNHWVTLHYDLKLKVVTLIDSRHWSFSFLYPTKTIVQMLKIGLDAVGVDTDGMVCNYIYQGVQLNDIYCGAWTLMNILALAGALSDDTPSKSIEKLNTVFASYDEADVVNTIIDFAESPIQKLAPLRGALERSFLFLGLCSYPIALNRALDDSQDKFVSSTAMITNVVGEDKNVEKQQPSFPVTWQDSEKKSPNHASFEWRLSVPAESKDADTLKRFGP